MGLLIQSYVLRGITLTNIYFSLNTNMLQVMKQPNAENPNELYLIICNIDFFSNQQKTDEAFYSARHQIFLPNVNNLYDDLYTQLIALYNFQNYTAC